jgi:penicillin G amidase
LKRILWRLFGGLLGIVGLVGICFAIYANLSVPAENANYLVSAQTGETKISLDQHGIPTIEAKSERDLAFAVGFMQARDRLWQLEMHRRIGRGQLAEVLGPKALDTDKFLRTLGVHKAAAAQFANFPDEDKAILRAYADGINSYVRDAMMVRPPEFVILGVQPGQWEPVDSVAWALMMAWDLGGNWNSELLRLQLAAKMPLARIDQLLPAQPGDTLAKHVDYAEMYGALGVLPVKIASLSSPEQETLFFLSNGTEGIGSNNWVVNGANTTTGKPLLANDPHLSLAAPAIWYYARLKAPGIEVTGATLPGMPHVVLGRTKGVAWGFTNTGPDVQDLYIEEINDKGEARTPEGWSKLSTRTETIKVKGEPGVSITVRESRHGPIISDAHIPTRAAINSAKFGVAMRWTALDADNQTAIAARKMNKAQTVTDVKVALRDYAAPQQNVVIADTAGNTEFIAAGRVPIRKPENDINGLAPSPGWDAKYDWAGWIAFEQLPQEVVKNYRATANQRIHTGDYPHYIASEWAHPGRKLRIEELLTKKSKHDAQSLRDIQHDLRHTHDVPLLDWVDKLPRDTFKRKTARLAIESFKGNLTSSGNEAGALLFWAWTREATRKIFADELGNELFDPVFGRRDFRAALNNVIKTNDAWWCDNKSTPAIETCEQILRAAFDTAIEIVERDNGEINENTGTDHLSWQHAHTARSEHRPFSNVPLLKTFFEIREPTAGDTYTVMVGKVRMKEPGPFTNDFAASLRAVYDLSVADANAATIIYSTGQSGNPFSRHYRSFSKPWAAARSSDYVDLLKPTSSGSIVLSGSVAQ